MLPALQALISCNPQSSFFPVNNLKPGDFPGGPMAKTYAPGVGGPGSTPGQGTRSHVPQPRVHMNQLKVPHATAEGPVYCNQD